MYLEIKELTFLIIYAILNNNVSFIFLFVTLRESVYIFSNMYGLSYIFPSIKGTHNSQLPPVKTGGL